jgi:diguanylate cyclase (GGDEF)-like protein/putative nucleotidyltransferase with HDIG domain
VYILSPGMSGLHRARLEEAGKARRPEVLAPPLESASEGNQKHHAEGAGSGRHDGCLLVNTAGMLTFLRHASFTLMLPGAAGASLIVLLVYRWFRSRTERSLNEAALLRYSNLHLFATTLSESGNPLEMGEQTLDRTLQALASEFGCLVLHSTLRDAPENLTGTSVRGFSSQLHARLTEGPLREFLATSAERWGALMIFPDLRKPGLYTAWQREPLFHEFLNVLLAEGMRTLLVLGLRTKDKCCGAILVGSARRRSYLPGELKLLLGLGNQISVALENRLLQKEAARHQEELRLLHRIGEALSATFDFQTQLRILNQELKGLLGEVNFTLALQDPADMGVDHVYAFSNGNGHPQGEALMDYVLNARAPLMLTTDFGGAARGVSVEPTEYILCTGGQPSSSPQFQKAVRSMAFGNGGMRIRTWCGVPVHFSDNSTGALALVDCERERALDNRQFEFLQVLASGVAVSIENARLFQREQRRARHLALLNEIGRKAAALLDPQEMMSSICPQIRKAFGYDLTRIETRGAAANELVVAAEDGHRTKVIGRRFKFGEGFAGMAAQSGQPVLANRVESDERYIALEPDVQSALSLPLIYGNETLGVLSVASFKEHSFPSQDVLTLGTLADQLAVALHNARAYQKASEQAIVDGLTQLKTHRYFMEALDSEWRRAPRGGHHFSLIMMDLDNFKPVNDRFGHLEGDRILVAVARLIESRCRQSNVVARYGGDEFAILMPEASVDQAEILAERLRAAMVSDPPLAEHGVTASFGIASFPVHGAAPEEILHIADAGMYLAKHQKGNCVRVVPMDYVSGGDGANKVLWEHQLLEAYLGVAVKRMFATGPEAFNQYFQRFQQAAQKAGDEGLSLLDTVTALAFAIDAKDHYTQGHSQAVSRLAAQVARHLGLGEAEVEEIRLGGILHDIGKIGVPETLLNKPSTLTPEEYEIMKTHTTLGWKILEPLRVNSIERIRRMVRHHHERFNGKGYPDGLKGDDIPLGARIISIADSFDTMISRRVYKEGLPVAEALAELQRARGEHFDTELVDAFFSCLESLRDPFVRTRLETSAN